jgi:hypothetical protein
MGMQSGLKVPDAVSEMSKEDFQEKLGKDPARI